MARSHAGSNAKSGSGSKDAASELSNGSAAVSRIFSGCQSVYPQITQISQIIPKRKCVRLVGDRCSFHYSS